MKKNKIIITKGVGKGPNQLSAYDQALFDADIGNFNLVTLSSVIPQNCKIIKKEQLDNKFCNGKKMYCVQSHIETKITNKEVWAGLGWVQTLNEGIGLFVEHHSFSKEGVIEKIINSLEYMQKYRDKKFGEIKYEVQGATHCSECRENKNDYIGSVVNAVYEVEEFNLQK